MPENTNDHLKQVKIKSSVGKVINTTIKLADGIVSKSFTHNNTFVIELSFLIVLMQSKYEDIN